MIFWKHSLVFFTLECPFSREPFSFGPCGCPVVATVSGNHGAYCRPVFVSKAQILRKCKTILGIADHRLGRNVRSELKASHV
jgi:hypothetical protein